ncbi:MAG: enoyl-CoA hydratase/isomerase family protein [Burkholderiales bacterium]|nr:enoyl-CoA hydratase/isomerase family protein [Burkholderiales bacterium]MBK8665729.1 enoyl-CoA hydratase/isomerase family protein [Burkholderiales bacterium]
MNHIEYSVAHSVATIRFNRPEKKNAITLEMYVDFTKALAKANADADVRAVLITGAGNAFTSGNDIANFRERTGREDGGAAEQFMLSIVNSDKPLVAAVNGVAIGVGATMLLHCDLVYASDNATIKMPFVSLGICSEFSSSLTLPAVMGMQRATEMLLLGDAIDARKAMEFGFVNAVYELEQLHEIAFAAAQRIAQQPSESVRTTREFLRAALRPNYAQRLVEERRMITELLGSPDARRAFDGFFARRGNAPGAAV